MNLTVILTIFFIPYILSFDPLSVGSGIAIGIGSYLYTKTYCAWKECCTEKEIPADFTKLKDKLNEKLYGQKLVHEVVINALKGHWAHDPPKALTLSFHGTAGCGKNYVASFIVESLYKYGKDSSHVHLFIGRIHFPREEDTSHYQKNLYSWIKGNVTRCPRQIFIFDEVDKIPPNVLNILKPVIDYNERVDSVDFRKAVFIFLSNTGGTLIADQFLKLWQLGVRRDDLHLYDFENLISKGAFNEEGGFLHSDTIKSNLIDHFIPFLPLEHEQVVGCIKDEFQKRGVNNPTDKVIEEVLGGVEWGPSPQNIFSKTGCKRLSQKVALTVQKYALNRN